MRATAHQLCCAAALPRAALCEFLLARRAWERQHVPLFKPQIAFDIILYCTLRSERSTPARPKDFHLAIGSSQDRVRQVLGELARDGWIEIAPDPSDARMKRIMPTARALAVIDDYGELLFAADQPAGRRAVYPRSAVHVQS